MKNESFLEIFSSKDTLNNTEVIAQQISTQQLHQRFNDSADTCSDVFEVGLKKLIWKTQLLKLNYLPKKLRLHMHLAMKRDSGSRMFTKLELGYVMS